MPHRGFTNLHGVPVDFADIAASYKREDWGLPLPALLAFAQPGNERPYEVGCSELAGDLQQACLKRKHDFYSEPEEELWRAVGTGVHAALERAAAASEAEVMVTAKIEGLLVGTRIDYLPQSMELTDWKTTSVYGVKELWRTKDVRDGKPEWYAQLNYMRGLMLTAGLADPRSLEVVVISRDRRPGEAAKERNYPPAIFSMPVPKAGTEDESKEALRARVAEFAAVRALVEAGSRDLPECKDLYRPMPGGLPSRCVQYCPVSEHCGQFNRIRERLRK